MDKMNVIGVMSGTSLDGIDLASCIFEEKDGKWYYSINYAETIEYERHWKERLGGLENSTAFDYVQTHIQYGHLLGKKLNEFIKKHHLRPDFVASHGHTIFHQPKKLITTQIGDGASIAAECGQTVVCDFRTLDVALGGQGAPLVPIGDKLLFSDYDICLNLGGFGNISFDENGRRIAFDTCPVNIVMNRLAQSYNQSYDKDGEFASKGKIDTNLLAELNAISFYNEPYPKSLGKEWVVENFNPILDSFNISTEDKLRTVCEHIVLQISAIINRQKADRMLVTGGGAKNGFLISLLKEKCNVRIDVPHQNIVDFKEALIFAFLGVLRIQNKTNCLKSVTGASRDNIGGAVYEGKE